MIVLHVHQARIADGQPRLDPPGDCASGNPIRSFKGLGALPCGGTASATNNQPAATNSHVAFAPGRAVRTAQSYTVTLRFYRFNADGSQAGAQRLVRTLTLAADGAPLTGTIAAQILDNNDAVLQSICGTETARRVG